MSCQSAPDRAGFSGCLVCTFMISATTVAFLAAANLLKALTYLFF